jgi:hypothetical protein
LSASSDCPQGSAAKNIEFGAQETKNRHAGRSHYYVQRFAIKYNASLHLIMRHPLNSHFFILTIKHNATAWHPRLLEVRENLGRTVRDALRIALRAGGVPEE